MVGLTKKAAPLAAGAFGGPAAAAAVGGGLGLLGGGGLAGAGQGVVGGLGTNPGNMSPGEFLKQSLLPGAASKATQPNLGISDSIKHLMY